MKQKQKKLLRLMAKIHRDCFKLDLEFKSAWFFPEHKAVKGYLGTDKIIFVCPNPSLGQFSSRPGPSSNAVMFFYKRLEGYGFKNAHLTDIVKSRLSSKQSKDLWANVKKYDSVIKKNVQWLKEEIKILDKNSKVKIIAVGNDAYDFLERSSLKEKLIGKIRHYANVEKYSKAHKKREREEFIKELRGIKKKIRA
jgi:hypothetical protein